MYSRVELLDVLGGVVVIGSSSSSCTSFKISFTTFIMVESFNGVLDAPPVLDLGDEDTTEDPRERIYSRVELLDVLGGVVVVGSSSSSCTSFKISFTTFIITESFNGVLDAPSVLDLGDEDTTEDPRERIYSRVELLDV